VFKQATPFVDFARCGGSGMASEEDETFREFRRFNDNDPVPDGGRTTIGGKERVRVAGDRIS